MTTKLRKVLNTAWYSFVGLVGLTGIGTCVLVLSAASATVWGPHVTALVLLAGILAFVCLSTLPSKE